MTSRPAEDWTYQDWQSPDTLSPGDGSDELPKGSSAEDRTFQNPDQCQLCGRVMRKGTTSHHLIPRTCHRNRWFQKNFSRQQMQLTVPLCRDCHSAIHRFVPKEKDLGRFYHSIPLLLSHPEINRFVSWVKDRK